MVQMRSRFLTQISFVVQIPFSFSTRFPGDTLFKDADKGPQGADDYRPSGPQHSLQRVLCQECPLTQPSVRPAASLPQPFHVRTCPELMKVCVPQNTGFCWQKKKSFSEIRNVLPHGEHMLREKAASAVPTPLLPGAPGTLC